MASRALPTQPAVAPGTDEEVFRKLQATYTRYMKPLEEMYNYDAFHPSWIEETLSNTRPLVTFFGPWSSGKTTFINYLLQGNYLHTGPQPTTASFTVVMSGKEVGPLDGRVLVNSKNLPFRGLNTFGEDFLQNFQGFQTPHPLLEKVTLIDTPGILEGTQSIHERSYDYVTVARWFVERSDMVFFLFDPTKLDSGAELKLMFTKAFRGFEGKLRIILNKADAIGSQELMRVYGSLFWNLSNIISTTEPPRVYVGSFWDQPYREGAFTLLFSEEKMDLLHELIEVVPQQARDRKIALLIRRAKNVLAHAGILGSIRAGLPALFGKGKAKKKAAENLPKTYEIVAARYRLNAKDFPPVAEYRGFLEKFDVEKFPELEKAEKRGLIAGVRDCIDTILPGMLKPIHNYAVSDPNNTSERNDLKRRYYDAVRQQYEGREGIQGSSDTVVPAGRPVAIERTALVPVSSSSPLPPPQANAAPPAVSSAQMQAIFHQMLQAQQQQQQQQQSPPQQSSPPREGAQWQLSQQSPLQPAPPAPARPSPTTEQPVTRTAGSGRENASASPATAFSASTMQTPTPWQPSTGATAQPAQGSVLTVMPAHGGGVASTGNTVLGEDGDELAQDDQPATMVANNRVSQAGNAQQAAQPNSWNFSTPSKQ